MDLLRPVPLLAGKNGVRREDRDVSFKPELPESATGSGVNRELIVSQQVPFSIQMGNKPPQLTQNRSLVCEIDVVVCPS